MKQQHKTNLFVSLILLYAFFPLGIGAGDGTLPQIVNGMSIEVVPSMSASLIITQLSDSHEFPCSLLGQDILKQRAQGSLSMDGSAFPIIGTCSRPDTGTVEIIADGANLIGNIRNTSSGIEFKGLIHIGSETYRFNQH